jgi:hypothetical protein
MSRVSDNPLSSNEGAFHSIRSAVDLNSPAKPRVRRGMAQHRNTLSAGLDRMIPLTDQA